MSPGAVALQVSFTLRCRVLPSCFALLCKATAMLSAPPRKGTLSSRAQHIWCLQGRRAAYQRLSEEGTAAARQQRTHKEPPAEKPALKPWVAEDGSVAEGQRSSGRVLAEMRNLRKVWRLTCLLRLQPM